MPAEYEHFKKKFLGQGMTLKEAKKHAAMIYNYNHPGKPLIRWIQQHEGRGGKK